MQELIAQLLRLYLPVLPEGAPLPEGLEQHLEGSVTHTFDLARDGAVRAIVIPFDIGDGDGAGQWERLCAVANALQGELGLPAPAVSISGGSGFALWLSFDVPVPVATAREFVDLLCAAYCPEAGVPDRGVTAPVALPPCRNAASGKWAAFIHPGMGASFADEPALEMAPPSAAQAAFLQGLQPIGEEQLRHALDVLRPAPGAAADQAAPSAGEAPRGHPAARAADDRPGSALPPDLLLKDATLEDIVRFLHAKNIEPTFRHVLPPR